MIDGRHRVVAHRPPVEPSKPTIAVKASTAPARLGTRRLGIEADAHRSAHELLNQDRRGGPQHPQSVRRAAVAASHSAQRVETCRRRREPTRLDVEPVEMAFPVHVEPLAARLSSTVYGGLHESPADAAPSM
jgi:hypothetical protein